MRESVRKFLNKETACQVRLELTSIPGLREGGRVMKNEFKIVMTLDPRGIAFRAFGKDSPEGVRNWGSVKPLQ